MPIDLPPNPLRMEARPATTSASSWQPSAETIAKTEKDRPGFLFREALIPRYTLPNVLAGPDGKPVNTPEAWAQHVRPWLIEQFENNEYGRAPKIEGVRIEQVSEDANVLGGKATRRCFRISVPTPGQPFEFTFWVFTPNHRSGRVAAFLLLNNRSVAAADPERKRISEFWPVETLIDRGYAAAELHLSDVQPDKPDGLSRGIVAALPGTGDPQERWATLAAWAWAAGRVLDGLQRVPEIDPTRVAVIGHSRGGKTALWAGATDPRFGMVIASCSGCGGAALARRRFGETLTIINKVFPHWFCGKYKTFNDHPENLPIDQHQLLALIAPRPLYIGCADEDLWADPRGEFLALAEASKVYSLYGQPTISPDEMPPLEQPLIRGNLGFNIRRGEHNLKASDWQRYLALADAVWGKK